MNMNTETMTGDSMQVNITPSSNDLESLIPDYRIHGYEQF